MNIDFKPDSNSLYIPSDVYKPKKQCPFCNSYFITDTSCESCGRLLDYNLVGKPFSYKSFYSMKERYIKELPYFYKRYPAFENKSTPRAKRYIRNAINRLKTLLNSMETPNLIQMDDRKLFYLEMKDIIDELLSFGVSKNKIKEDLLLFSQSGMILNDLIHYVESKRQNELDEYSSLSIFLNIKVLGLFRMEFLLKFGIIMAVLLYTAIKFKSFFY